ncbi:ABC transporter permease [Streptomyces sp. NPDC048639]|uniref:ABC transporter permease n=1 Tax=Streptomyces sp. NPDC048639 TaxID=3365581 RepID=UPI0037164E1E
MTTPYQQHGAAPLPPQAPPQGGPPPAAPPHAQDPQQAPGGYAHGEHRSGHAQGGQQHGHQPGPGGHGMGYHSPMPVRRTHIGHALASEWTKIRTVRSTMWTLGIMFALVVGIGLLTAVGLSGSDETQTPLLSGGFFGLMLGQICIITLGVLVVTSEYGTGMIRTTLTACPSRGRVFAAKAIIFFLLSFVMTTVATGLTALINSSMLGGRPPSEFAAIPKESIEAGKVIATSSEWLGATVGAGLYVALLGLLSLAVGGILRHSAGAITAMLGVVLLPLLLALFMSSESLEDVREALVEYSPLNGLASLYRIPMDGGNGTGWDLLWILAGATAAALAAAFALLEKRDV